MLLFIPKIYETSTQAHTKSAHPLSAYAVDNLSLPFAFMKMRNKTSILQYYGLRTFTERGGVKCTQEIH